MTPIQRVRFKMLNAAISSAILKPSEIGQHLITNFFVSICFPKI